MKTKLLLIVLLGITTCSAQQNAPIEKIKGTLMRFLKWHQAEGEYKKGQNYFVPRYDGKDSIKTYYDPDSLENYYNNFRETGLVSEQYINQLKNYFNYYGKFIGPEPADGEIIKRDGLDQDMILGTFEPEAILDNLNKATITKSLIIYNKALVGINFSREVNMEFVLSREKEKWLIDYVGHDNTSADSFFRQ